MLGSKFAGSTDGHGIFEHDFLTGLNKTYMSECAHPFVSSSSDFALLNRRQRFKAPRPAVLVAFLSLLLRYVLLSFAGLLLNSGRFRLRANARKMQLLWPPQGGGERHRGRGSA